MRFLRWSLLVLGVLCVLWPIIALSLMAIVVHPNGGIPWTIHNVANNARLAVFWSSVFVGGMVMIGGATILFLQGRGRE